MSSLRDLPSPAITPEALMLATPGKLFSAPGWIFELKYDGFRCLIAKSLGAVTVTSRNGRDLGRCFPEIVEAARAVATDFVCDGELVMLDESGRPRFEALTRRNAMRSAARIAASAAGEPACVFAFDLLWLDGADLRERPLLERKAALYDLLRQRGRIRHAGHFAGSSRELWQLVLQLELEGIVAKDAASTYTAGRSTRWQKIKTPAGEAREAERRSR